ncbi:MAG: peptidase M23 [Desulfuromonas sp.]|nr:MAG: peptidase M23 [Desulfuromonas sp.]
MNHDFNPPRGSNLRNKRKRRSLLPLYMVAFAIIAISVPFIFTNITPNTEAHTEAPPKEIVPEIRREFIEGAVSQGDSISVLLDEYLTLQEIDDLNRKSRSVFPLSRICTGQPYKICLTEGEFERFEYDINSDEQLIIIRGTDNFDVSRQPIDYMIKTDLVRGTIETSLFDAVTSTDEAPELAMNLADIFAWDIDFILDIRKGDSFQALVEKRFRDGEPAGYGRILAAEFNNRGETFRAFYYRDGESRAGYYDENGESVRKMFLKAPLSFSRISSGFTMRRYHPITKTWKAHPAIDYAAPTGTPIKAVGDGTIVKIAKDRNNGRHIKLRHNGTYQTLYLHMNSFARGMKKGKRVSQGQVIGYVGSTGLATGPHLCFRMYKHGRPVNPSRVKAKSAKPVSEANLTAFKSTIEPLLARFESRTMVARSDHQSGETIEQQ